MSADTQFRMVELPDAICPDCGEHHVVARVVMHVDELDEYCDQLGLSDNIEVLIPNVEELAAATFLALADRKYPRARALLDELAQRDDHYLVFPGLGNWSLQDNDWNEIIRSRIRAANQRAAQNIRIRRAVEHLSKEPSN